MRRRGKIDGNHRDVVETFRAHGWSVVSLADVGGGVPDLLVATPWNLTFLVEVKMPKEPLNAKQSRWHADWHGRVEVVRGVGDTENLIHAHKSDHDF